MPFFIHVPGTKGGRTNAIGELVDLFPTLIDLTNVSIPDRDELEGRSLAPLFEDAASPQFFGDDIAAFSQFPRCNGTVKIFPKANSGTVTPWALPSNNPCTETQSENFMSMGYSIRTDLYRYTVWVKWVGAINKPDWDATLYEELYCHQGDDGRNTDSFEYENLASDASLRGVKTALLQRVKKHFAS